MAAEKPIDLKVAILLFDDVEELDFAGPYEVFAVASRMVDEGVSAPCRFVPFTVAEEDRPIHCKGGLTVLPDHDFDSCPHVDLLVVPGGWGTRREVDNPKLIAWIRRISRTASLSTSVCTGAFLLAKTGVLDGLEATTHWASLERLRESFPGIRVREDLRIVDQGSVVTSAGISSGIDMALHLVARLAGKEMAFLTARRMEYRWEEQA